MGSAGLPSSPVGCGRPPRPSAVALFPFFGGHTRTRKLRAQLAASQAARNSPTGIEIRKPPARGFAFHPRVPPRFLPQRSPLRGLSLPEGPQGSQSSLRGRSAPLRARSPLRDGPGALCVKPGDVLQETVRFFLKLPQNRPLIRAFRAGAE